MSRVDSAAVVAVLVDGFADDPWFRWLWPADRDYQRHAAAWFGLVADVASARGEMLVSDDGAAAAIWMPPGAVLVDPDTLAAAAGLLREQLGDRADVALTALGASAAHEPAEAHHACVYVAVRSGARGNGLGEQVMRPPLAAADADGVGAHLVSTTARNLGFYRRLGFEVTAEVPVADGAVTFRPMWRPPVRS